LHILFKLGYKCIAAHCNFYLRMEESLRDEEFVRNLAHSYSIPYYNVDFNTIEYAKTNKISIEMAARDLRYEWFNELLIKTNAQAIAVAHHADDSIETMLMNLVRGTGLRGIVGIASRNQNVVRPLLCCTRLELEKYLIEHDLEHVEDTSNAANEYVRNQYRNVLLPLLLEINPSARQNLYSSLQNLEGNLAIYQQAIEQIRQQVVENKLDEVRMNIDIIRQQVHIPTVMHELLSPYHFSSSTVEQITEHLEGESGRVFYSETHRLVKDRKYLIISAKGLNERKSFFISQEENELTDPIHLSIKRIDYSAGFSFSRSKDCVHIDAANLEFPLQLRRWNEGDWFYPFGMNRKKKLSDFFIDNKFSLVEKEQTWLLISNNEIVWIVGHRLDNRYRVTDKTKEVLEIRLLLH